MVRFIQNLDRNNKLYIPRVLRDAGFLKTVEIIPDTHVVAMFPKDIPLPLVLASLRILVQIIQQRVETEETPRSAKVEI